MKIREGKYLLKLAETPEEKDQIYSLRYNVYCKEMNFAEKKNEYAEETVKEYDSFDELCDHLIIIDEDRNCCVGTFRFLAGGKLPKGQSFYSEQWFDLGKLRDKRSNVLELGRACIDPQYRNTSVFKLLFSGVGCYLKMYPHDYLIGLTTLPANARDDIDVISKYLLENNAINLSFGIKPIKKLDIPAAEHRNTMPAGNQREIIKKMSTLMFAYYKYGAEFISEPSMDVDFNPPVFDYFTIFDTQKFPAWV